MTSPLLLAPLLEPLDSPPTFGNKWLSDIGLTGSPGAGASLMLAAIVRVPADENPHYQEGSSMPVGGTIP